MFGLSNSRAEDYGQNLSGNVLAHRSDLTRKANERRALVKIRLGTEPKLMNED